MELQSHIFIYLYTCFWKVFSIFIFKFSPLAWFYHYFDFDFDLFDDTIKLNFFTFTFFFYFILTLWLKPMSKSPEVFSRSEVSDGFVRGWQWRRLWSLLRYGWRSMLSSLQYQSDTLSLCTVTATARRFSSDPGG